MTFNPLRSRWPTGLYSAIERRSLLSTVIVADEDALAERLAPFDIVCVMRERTALKRGLIRRLPKS
jgi:hypothetical protein